MSSSDEIVVTALACFAVIIIIGLIIDKLMKKLTGL